MVKKEHVLCAYVSDASLPKVDRDAATKLTHINVAFGHVKQHRVTIDHLKNGASIQTIRQYNPEITILLSLGGWGAGGFSDAASTESARKTFAETAVQALKKYDFDGIDVDWEYPCYSVAGIESRSEDKGNFTLLLQTLREELDKQSDLDNRRYVLSIATGADQYFIDGTEMDRVQQYLDIVQLMTYDMRGGFQTLTGHHTNLYTPTGDLFRISVDESVKKFVGAGVPKEKIVIGAAFYSRMWKDVPNQNDGLYQMTASFGGYGPVFSDIQSQYLNQNGFQRYWDDEAKAAYLFNGDTFISYDDEQSLRCKVEYLKENGLAGIMYWEFGCDQTGTLLQALFDSMNT